MSQNGVPEMAPSGTFRVSLSLWPWCTTFGIIWGNFGDTARKCLEHWKTRYILNEPSISPKFPQIIPKVVHHGRRSKSILNMQLGIIFGTLIWLILHLTHSRDCSHITRYTDKSHRMSHLC